MYETNNIMLVIDTVKWSQLGVFLTIEKKLVFQLTAPRLILNRKKKNSITNVNTTRSETNQHGKVVWRWPQQVKRRFFLAEHKLEREEWKKTTNYSQWIERCETRSIYDSSVRTPTRERKTSRPSKPWHDFSRVRVAWSRI